VSHSDLSDTSENNLRTEGKQGSEYTFLENRGQSTLFWNSTLTPVSPRS